MLHVATFICPAAGHPLDDATLELLASALPERDSPRWLAPGIAAEIAFEADERLDRKALANVLRDVLPGLPLDIAVLPAEGRRKNLLLADMDSTMIGQECIDELAAEVGLKDRIAAITERAMRGEIAFEPALRERVALLAELDLAVTEHLLEHRITLDPGARALVRTMRAHGAHTALVSGGFTVFTGPVAEKIGFHEHRANTLLIENGRLVGRVAEPILGREAKLASLIELRDRLGLAHEQTLAVGDGANDLAMIEQAGLGIAYHAKPAVAAAAEARIDHADLTALLYIQGYHKDEIIGN